ncbi:MAG: hypothetical protein A2048_09610 [Deltaproteobacteria bacterium GWA2_45_12]|nr:MAG: hypothetical protein A2048_09610 [Deltaproteobacteria bacterium GWA2_45_12]
MGTGKSTIGLALAQKLNRPFIDMDAVLEKKLKSKIATIFKKKGEAFFRDEETKLLLNLVNNAPAVISTGGGIVLRAQNRALLKRGLWINLNTSSAIIEKRIEQEHTRPLLPKTKRRQVIETLLNSRRPFYALAPFQINTDSLAVDAIIHPILRVLKCHKSK